MNVPERVPVLNVEEVNKGSTSRKKKKRSYTVTEKVIQRNRDARTEAINVHRRKVNHLGMFRVHNHESADTISEALEECSHTKKHLVIPYFLIRAFDEDLYKAGIMSFLLYMEGKLTNKKYKWFVAKYPDVEKYTGAKRKRIVAAMQDFRDSGIIQTKRKGIPAMQHYKIDKDMLIQLCMERVLNYQDPLIELGIAEVV